MNISHVLAGNRHLPAVNPAKSPTTASIGQCATPANKSRGSHNFVRHGMQSTLVADDSGYLQILHSRLKHDGSWLSRGWGNQRSSNECSAGRVNSCSILGFCTVIALYYTALIPAAKWLLVKISVACAARPCSLWVDIALESPCSASKQSTCNTTVIYQAKAASKICDQSSVPRRP